MSTLLAVEDLHVAYGKVEAVSGVSLEMQAGQIVTVIGPNGAGKTTMLAAIMGLLPSTGTVRYDGADMRRFGTEERVRRGICLVPESRELFTDMTVADNLILGAYTHWNNRKALDAELDQVYARFPRLAERRTQLAGTLSGGERQMLALGRALMAKPRLLLLDEPFAALDAPARRELGARLRESLAATRTPALFVTHAQDEALALGDRLLLMAEGRIVQDGRPAEVFSRPAAHGLVEEGTVIPVRILERAHGLVRLQAGTAGLWAPDPGGLETEAFASIRPEGVALELGAAPPGSPRNRLPARIVALEPEGPLVRVKLDAGFPLDALVTAWACEDLKLAPGQALAALVKATAITLSPAP